MIDLDHLRAVRARDAHRVEAVLKILGLLFVLAAIAIGFASAGCGAGARAKALSATFHTVDATADGFAAWDAIHQDAIVARANTADEGRANLAAYRDHRAVVLSGFEVAYRAIAAAALGRADLAGALVAAERVYDMVEQLEYGTTRSTP